MWVPLAVLAVLSVLGGWVGVAPALGQFIGIHENKFEHFLKDAIAQPVPFGQATASGHEAAAASHGTQPAESHAAASPEAHHDTGTELGLTLLSVVVGLLGIGLGLAIFSKKPLRHMPKILEDKYRIDELYEASVIQPIEHTSRSFLWKVVDVKLIDGAVNGVAKLMAGLAGILRHTQTGFARGYAAVILVGAIVVIGYFGYIALR